jgi:hypothetical protein
VRLKKEKLENSQLFLGMMQQTYFMKISCRSEFFSHYLNHQAPNHTLISGEWPTPELEVGL